MNDVNVTPLQHSARSNPAPNKIIVSLRAGIVLAVANVLCAAIIAFAYTRVKEEPKVIAVTGSAKQVIESDLVVWQAKISVNDPELVHGYEQLKSASDKTLAWLKAHGVPDEQVKLSSIWTKKNNVHDEKGNATDKISSYDLIQTVEISSPDVSRVAAVAREATDLIKDGVMLESEPPRYLYTKMADLKITMLAEATKDATTRARQIATNSGARLGSIRDARMGVMQINALHSNEVSDSGNNDTTSQQKEITAVVSARFELE